MSQASSTRFAVLTSVETRHRFAARFLHRSLNVVAVGYERTGYSPADVDASTELTADQLRIVREHYAERARQEERFFGHDAAFILGEDETDEPQAAGRVAQRTGMRRGSPYHSTPSPCPLPGGGGNAESGRSCAVLHIQPGDINTAGTLRFLEVRGVEAVLVFGTNLLKPLLLDRFAGRIINLHLGLSPYYRGTATNFYPLLNGEPEYVGATIHLIDAGIDSGPIVHHARPDIVAGDRPHSIGCKAILAGLEKLRQAADELAEGRLRAVPQWSVESPRVYRRRDFHPRHVVELYEKLAGGLIERYVARADAVAPRVNLIP